MFHYSVCIPVQCAMPGIWHHIMNIQTASRPLLKRPADGHWHSYELLRHCCCQWFDDQLLQSAKLHASASLQKILIFLQEFSGNTIANGTLFNKQPRFVWGGNSLWREFVWRKYLRVMSGEQDIRRNSSRREMSGYICATLVNTHTHSQTDSQTGWETDIGPEVLSQDLRHNEIRGWMSRKSTM